MAYLALYRRWRPKALGELKGQSHVRGAIHRAIEEGKIGHAYLFAGPRGTGKTSTAKILAKALNCLNLKDGEPCGECESCKKIDAGASMNVFEIDAASNRGIDEIRDLRETVKFAPVDGKYKVYIIDEVHMLTTEAFNALLKTLEEPPDFVIFILATTEAHKVPATIQSRCQRYDFRRISVAEIEERLRFVSSEMEFDAEDEALSLIATHADGGLRDALSLLDQCAAMGSGKITKADVEDVLGLVGNAWIAELAEAIGNRDTKTVISKIAEITKKGKELPQIINELSLALRTVMISGAANDTSDELLLYKLDKEILEKLIKLFDSERIIFALKKLNEANYALKWTNAPRITVETTLLSLCYEGNVVNNSLPTVNVDDNRIARLEAMVRELSLKLSNANNFVKSEISIKNSSDNMKPTISSKISKNEISKNLSEQKNAPISKEINNQPQNDSKVKEEKIVVSPSADSAELWQKVLSGIEATANKNVLVCLKQGVCEGVTEKNIVVSFPSEMLASIAMRLYKKLVEDTIKKISGNTLSLVTKSRKKGDFLKTPAKQEITSSVSKPITDISVEKPKVSVTQKETEIKNISDDTQNAVVSTRERDVTASTNQSAKIDLSGLSEVQVANLKKATDVFGDNFVSSIDVKSTKIAESVGNKPSLKLKAKILSPADEYDFIDEPDFSDIPPPDMEF